MSGNATAKNFDQRLVAYTPLGARLNVIPDLGFTVTSTNNGGATLSATVSTAIAGALPVQLEIIVEWWHVSTQTWQEGRDSRFAITQFQSDDRDATGTVTLTGIDIASFEMAAAMLKGVDPYVNTTGTSEAARSNSSVSVSGTTFTWTGHVLSTGDRVRISSVGNAKNLNSGSIYYVINPTTNTFQLAAGANSSTAKNCGTATNVSMSRVVTRINFTGAHSFSKSDSVSTVGGSAVGLTDGTQYYVVNAGTSSIQLTDKPGGTPIELSAASTGISQIYRYLDGQRVFTSATPGTVMSTVFLEARNRGWGVGLDGMTQMTHSWTVSTDSTGAAWTTLADDPSTPGVSIGFQPGTPMTQVMQAMTDNAYAEWYLSPGHVIGLVNYGTGNDHTVDANPKRIGTSASALQVQTDLTSLRNAVTVRGTGPILVEQDSTAGAWGRLEVYETASGATSKSLATKQASNDLAANNAPTVAYTVTEMAQEAAWLPLKDYSRGDWVAIQLSNSGWSKLRCVGWSFAKDTTGAITVTVNLAAIKQELIAKMAKKSTKSTAGLSATSTGQSLLETDNRKPAYPLGVTVSTSGFFAADDTSQSTATVSWLPVVADIAGGDVQVTSYDVWLRPEGKQFGQSVGQTAGLSMDITPLPSGHTYEVSVRALSSAGEWGELCPEVEFSTSYSLTVPNSPTAPTVHGSLGSVRVSWDGNLIDANGNTVAATDPSNAGFAYVYAQYAGSFAALTSGGGISGGTPMGVAGTTVIGGLTVGSTYYFALFAENSVGTVSAISGVVSFTVVGITGPDITANSVTANQIATGAITSDKLSVGTVPASSTPLDRVPAPLVSTSYWTEVINNVIPLNSAGNTLGSVTSSTSGITFNGTSGTPAQLTVTALNPIPPSGAVFISMLSGSGSVFPQVTSYDPSGANLGTANVAYSVNGVRYSFPATAATYYVKLTTTGGVTVTDTVVNCHVFEVISTQGAGQGVELSPAGLQFYDNNGSLAMDLTTGSQQFISVFNATGGDPMAVASIDQSGNATFNEVSTNDDFDDGTNLLFGPAANNLRNALPNGGVTDWAIQSPDGTNTGIGLLDIPGRSVFYQSTWPSQDGRAITTQYFYVASDVFQVEDGRAVMLVLNNGGLQINSATNGSSKNIYGRWQLALSPFAAAPVAGATISQAVIQNGSQGYFAHAPQVWRASSAVSSIDYANYVLPAYTPIYWQYYMDLSSAPSASYQLDEFGQVRGLTVLDVGSSQLLGTPVNAYDGRTSGSQTVGTTSTPTVTSKTVTFYANSSRTWNNSGANIVTGSGQYTNGAAMYAGTGATPMGSWFGNFKTSGGTTLASALSGKTVTNAVLTIHCNYTYSASGSNVNMGTGSMTTAPSTIGTPSSHTFSSGTVKAGQSKSITLSSGIRTDLPSGAVSSFVLGVESGQAGVYSYFSGATQSDPPKLVVTYH